MATEHAEKVVLIRFGERKRPVTFQSSIDPAKEKESLLNAVKDVFDDVLKEEEKDQLVLSVKSEQWKGEYVELHGGMSVESNSVVCLSVDAQSSAKEVLTTLSYKVTIKQNSVTMYRSPTRAIKKIVHNCHKANSVTM